MVLGSFGKPSSAAVTPTTASLHVRVNVHTRWENVESFGLTVLLSLSVLEFARLKLPR